MDEQISMFEAPPLLGDPQLTHIPIKVWRFETPASADGREFLKIITEVDPIVIDNNYAPHAIEAWLEEMEYEWTGSCWRYVGDDE